MPSADSPADPTLHALYCDHHGWLRDWLRRRLGSACDAADLAHDIFMRLLIRPRTFDSFDGARAYLGAMARGLCVDLWRRREIERLWLETLAAQPEAVVPSAEQQTLIVEALCAVDAMLNRLPPRVARAFALAQIDGLTYRQIARELGVSERSVKNYMATAMLQCALFEAEWFGADAAPAAVAD